MQAETISALFNLPDFNAIDLDSLEGDITSKIEASRRVVETAVKQECFTWNTLVEPLDLQSDVLDRVWSPISHLKSVLSSDELRKVYNTCLPLLSSYGTELSQNKALYSAFVSLKKSAHYAELNTAQKKVIDNEIRSFELGGVSLEGDAKERYKAIQLRLSELRTKFEENILDATNHWKLHFTEESALAGLPPHALSMAQQNAEREGKSGWLVNLEFPMYFAVVTYAENRDLREQVYRAFSTRASDQGENPEQWDNGPVMLEILALRKEKAALLGFENYAEFSVATKMADNAPQVVAFLTELAEKGARAAKREFETLAAFAQQKDKVELAAWDVAYYSEKLKQAEYEISAEALKPYFPVDQAIEGLFYVAQQLFGIRIEQVEGIATWHDDARFYIVKNEHDDIIAGFYLDLYARENKRGGAWMDSFINRYRMGEKSQLPVAQLVCNLTPPVGDEPALLTHSDVTTLFHEFGHGLQHMLTQVDALGVSGISGVEWDAVELPSQLMENWCWQEEALHVMAKHYKTGEALPTELLQKAQRAKNFQAAMMLVRQLEFALFDMRLHMQDVPDSIAAVQHTLDQVRADVAVVKAPEYNRFQNSFSHIFAGGYAAGYYSYKWAEVLSCDAFSRFEEEGVLNPETGRAFMAAVLEPGGSEPAADLFKRFRGREPSIEPLLRHCGLLETN